MSTQQQSDLTQPLSHEDSTLKIQPEQKSSKKNGQVIILLGVIFLGGLVIGAVAGIVVYSQVTKGDDVDKTTEETTKKADDNSVDSISITEPTSDTAVEGRVKVIGTVTGAFSVLRANLYDKNDILLGTGTVTLNDSSEGKQNDWTLYVDVVTSPGTDKGNLVVFPDAEGESSQLAQSTGVIFPTMLDKNNRVKLYAPLDNQVLTSGSVRFRGQMKDFFEATIGLRLLDESGDVIYQTGLTALSDNYGQFADFDQVVDIGVFPVSPGETGKWELYEDSAADGTTTVLLTINVRFAQYDI